MMTPTPRRLSERRKYAQVERVRKVVDRRRWQSEQIRKLYGCPIDRYEKWLMSLVKETPDEV